MPMELKTEKDGGAEMKKIYIIMTSILLCIICVVVGISIFLKQDEVVQQPKEKISKKQVLSDKEQPSSSNEGKKVAYLTIDDGPTEYMSKILTALKKENVKATFFLIGNRITGDRKKDIKEAAEEGHSIGLHSMSHVAKRLYKDKQFIPEIEKESKLLNTILDKKTKLVRAPYGSTYLNDDQVGQLKKDKYRLLDWNIDSEDWKHKGKPEKMVSFIKEELNKFKKISPVILIHETEDLLKAIPDLVKTIRAKGFELKPYFEDNDFHLNFKKDPQL